MEEECFKIVKYLTYTQEKEFQKEKKSIAFSIELADTSKTLTDEEVTECMTKITENLNTKFGAN